MQNKYVCAAHELHSLFVIVPVVIAVFFMMSNVYNFTGRAFYDRVFAKESLYLTKIYACVLHVVCLIASSQCSGHLQICPINVLITLIVEWDAYCACNIINPVLALLLNEWEIYKLLVLQIDLQCLFKLIIRKEYSDKTKIFLFIKFFNEKCRCATYYFYCYLFLLLSKCNISRSIATHVL